MLILTLHRNLFYGSFLPPRALLWSIGVTIFVAMMATAFIGYVLPWGQMSLWGATVITNLLSVDSEVEEIQRTLEAGWLLRFGTRKIGSLS